MQAKYVSHPLVKPNTVEVRLYQEVIVAKVLEQGNTLVVAPTALGKTIVAVMLAAHLLYKNPKSKIVLLAPTKPLAMQHAKSMIKFLKVEEEAVSVFTGTLPPNKRKQLWDNSTVIIATPQTIENDLINKRLSLEDVSLMIFDEAHRAVENYSYVFIAGQYVKHAKKPLIVALTASPGSNKEKIDGVCKNLFIKNIEIKSPKDFDVRPYTQEIEVEWLRVQLPEEFIEIKKLFEAFMKDQLDALKKLGVVKISNVRYFGKGRILELQSKVRKQIITIGREKPYLFQAATRVAALMKISHANTLLETQGISALKDYLERMLKGNPSKKRTKALVLISTDPRLKKAVAITKKLSDANTLHPKYEKLKGILLEQFSKNPESKTLVFNHYRDSVGAVVKYLEQFPEIKPRKFIGQASRDKDKGMSQKEQAEIIEELKSGTYNTLVATSVAEEGLDIPAVDLVVFFEAVPSEIRSIQRRGRTGRFAKGRVVVLMAKGTMDEAFHWASVAKERKMQSTLKGMKREMKDKTIDKQSTLVKYVKNSDDKIIIYVDTREQSSGVVKELLGRDVDVKIKQLEVGDYVLTDQIVVERKTVSDFLQSIVDGRLFAQLVSTASNYDKPLVIIEGNYDELFTERDMHRNAILGALTSIATTYRVPVLFTADAAETAEYLYVIAKREQLGKDSEIRLRVGRKGLTTGEQQQFIVESLPLVGPKMAKKLLEKFESIKGILEADIKKMQEVENMGPKKAKQIRDIIDANYKPE